MRVRLDFSGSICMARHLPLAAMIWLTLTAPSFGDEAAQRDANGILVHTIRSPLQDGPTKIRVLLPTKWEKDRRYRVLYILPVEAGDGAVYGDGLREVQKRGLHDKYGLVCVMPTFARLPWYADHPTNKRIQQESYLLKEVLPFVEKNYPVLTEPKGRLLLGFSKSGWGAFSLLLRHPEVFGQAAAWDAPLDMDAPGKYGSGAIFGPRENFRKYEVMRLLKERAGQLGKGRRLVLLGHGNFRAAHRAAHALMDQMKIEHEYRDGPKRKHDWHSGWVAEAVEILNRAPGSPLKTSSAGSGKRACHE
jgi:S-formylglutathione hydrolase FrmB